MLGEGGLLLVTTPNIASLGSVAAVLGARKNPQVFGHYPLPGNPDTPHVREYTPHEMAEVLSAAGFQVESILTESPRPNYYSWVEDLLIQHGFATSLRGEQMYCLARKRTGTQRQRYPAFLYASGEGRRA